MEEGQKERKEMKGEKREKGEGRKGGKETEEIPWSDLLLNMAVSGHDNWSEVANFQLGKEQSEDKFNAKEVREEKGKNLGILNIMLCLSFSSVQFISVAQSCPTLCDPMPLINQP